MFAGPIEAQDRQRVDLAVDLADPLFQHIEQIERGDIAGLQLVDDGAGGFPHQALIGHSHLSIWFRTPRMV